MQSGLKWGSWRDWASMARLPNLPTVWSNVFTGWVFGWGSFATMIDWVNFCWVLLLATMFYVGGTVLNDCHDADYDRKHRPERPIPSERVSGTLACLVGMLLLAAATVLSFAVAAFFASDNALCCLLPLILIYTFIHKPFPIIGGIFMGLCRMALGLFSNIYVGSMWGVDMLAAVQILWALTLFFYVCAVSWVAMGEKVKWRRNTVVWMLTALPLLDALFLPFAGEARMVFVPIACAGLAWYLRRVASPT